MARNRVWKVRHKATGLFYKPGSSGPLDAEGKIYTTRSTIMSMLSDERYTQTVCIYKSMPAYRKYAGIYEALAASGGDKYVSKGDKFIYRMSGGDFELVEYGVEYKEIGVVKTERYE